MRVILLGLNFLITKKASSIPDGIKDEEYDLELTHSFAEYDKTYLITSRSDKYEYYTMLNIRNKCYWAPYSAYFNSDSEIKQQQALNMYPREYFLTQYIAKINPDKSLYIGLDNNPDVIEMYKRFGIQTMNRKEILLTDIHRN
jgi:hypothetical protein